MQDVDKGMAELKIFNKNNQIDATIEDEKAPTSVLQLKELLRNYEGIVEAQHQLLQTSMTKMSNIPPPDEIQANFSRFQVLKEEELQEMRNFLNDHKQVMATQYKDFELEKQQFQEMNTRMDDEKSKVILEREKIENEIRSIKTMNEDLFRQHNIGHVQ
jgi:hypothetical protein